MSDQTTEDPDVTAWIAAFQAANRKDPDHIPRYEGGWFVWRAKSGYFRLRRRRKDLQGMTVRLRERANVTHA